MSSDTLPEIDEYEKAKRAYTSAMRDFFQSTIHFSRDLSNSSLAKITERAESLQATYANVNRRLAHLEQSYAPPQSVQSGHLIYTMEHGEHGRPTLEFLKSGTNERLIVRFGDWLRVRETSGEVLFEGFVSEEVAASVISERSDDALAFGDHSLHVAREWFRRELLAEYSPGVVSERSRKPTSKEQPKVRAM